MLRYLIAPALGVMAVFGFAPFYLWPLPLLALAGLFHLWAVAPGARRAALDGFGFGLGFFGAGVSWIHISLHDFGAMPLAAALAATTLFCALMALFPALTGFLQGRWRVSPAIRLLVLLPALWGLSEWLRGAALTGFPWLAAGYSQVPAGPLAGLAPVLGVYGVSLALAVMAGVLALLFRPGERRRALATLVLLAGMGLLLRQVSWVEPFGTPLRVSLLQGNIAQDLKWQPETARHTLETYARLSAASKGQLIVLPETALPMFLEDVPASYLAQLAHLAQQRGGDAVVGIPEEPESGTYFNSAFSFGSAPTQTYRKTHLVPFGEYLPLRPVFSWVLTILHIPLSDFSRGPSVQHPMAVAGQHLAVDICYEDAFGEEIIRQLPRATLLANLTNDAWFGRSIGPWQHLQIAQMRALESGRYLLRATNTGVTAIIDQHGAVIHLAPVFSTTLLEGVVQGFQGSTPYVRHGNLPALLLMALLLILAWKSRH